MINLKNKSSILLLIILISEALFSCTKISKKISKEASEEIVENTTNKLSAKSIKGFTLVSIKHIEWDDLLKFTKLEHPVLHRQLSELHPNLRETLLNYFHFNPASFTNFCRQYTILDEFMVFSARSHKAQKTPNIFAYFINKRVQEGSELSVYLTERNGVISFLNVDNHLIAQYDDAIITCNKAFKEGSTLFSETAFIKDDILIPNSIYKIERSIDNLYRFKVDEVGRISSVDATNISIDELRNNIINIKSQFALGDGFISELKNLEKILNGSKFTSKITFSYVDNTTIPSSLDIEYNKGFAKIRKSFPNLCKVPAELPNARQVNKVINKLCKGNSFFKPDKFIIEQTDRGYYVRYIGDLDANANTIIFVRNDGIIEATSAKKASGYGKYGTNEFLMNLLPRQKYIIDGSIEVETDNFGRIIKSNANVTRLAKGSKGPRNPNVQKIFTSQGGNGYEGGHLHSHAQGGPDELEVAMHYGINHNKLWRHLEDKEAQAAKEGKKVISNIVLEYEGDSTVPIRIIKTSIIDGKETKLVCNNITGEVVNY